MNFSVYKMVFLAAAFGMIGATTVLAGTPYPAAGTPDAVDRGPLTEQTGAGAISVTIALKLRDPEGAETLLRRLNTPGDEQFHKFLTPGQFQTEFGPAEADVEKARESLNRYGLTVERASSLTLRATGTPAILEQAFRVHLRQFEVPAKGGTPSYSFHAGLERPTVPAEIAPLVHAVLGLDNRPSFYPHNLRASAALGRAPLHRKTPSTSTTGNPPGFWTVTDFASYYDVQPLYTKGVNGSGRTVGIVTLASFTSSDVFAYWSALGLSVDPHRVTVVDIDGGPGAPSDVSGSDETTLDVEQSGGVAPAAQVIVYQAPNTNQGFLDGFASAIDANLADSISTSWGSWEWENDLENGPVTDPLSGKTFSLLQAAHELFVKAAVQGQSMFAAAGDQGAYDVFGEMDNNGVPIEPPYYSVPLTVDYPASDPAITAAGGTTLGGSQTYLTPIGSVVINIPRERVWGWDYLEPLCDALGLSPIGCGIYPAGGGGGVSVFFRTPLYQQGLAGVHRSQPNQVLVDEVLIPPEIVFSLPANFAGRNVPDVSMNADPQTGYVLYYTSDVTGFGIFSYFGGTSFVAPQLNGVTALLDQNSNHRLGLLNYAFYLQARLPTAYQGFHPPLRYIIDGDNWFYSGRQGYSPAAGIGTLDVSNLAEELSSLSR
jgi:kumamolisin